MTTYWPPGAETEWVVRVARVPGVIRPVLVWPLRRDVPRLGNAESQPMQKVN